MAKMCTFTHSAMGNQNGHIDRQHIDYSNTDIDPTRTQLNYSRKMEHNGMSPTEYYHHRVDEVYMYFRGTKRESESVTGVGWVVTCPNEIAGDKVKEEAFFKGVYDFIENRYGKENIINNVVHYDEGVKNDDGEVIVGLPHIHVIVIPITELDHDIVQYKTKVTKQYVLLDSGRYEMKHIHVDKDGNKVSEDNPESWVKLNNYKKMSDYYDEKVDCNAVFNKIELKHFHDDLQKYLDDNHIEGRVKTGKTGTNYTVAQLKELTKTTGLTLNQLEELIPKEKNIFEEFVQNHNLVEELQKQLEKKVEQINTLSEERTFDNDNDILLKRIEELEEELQSKREELNRSNERINELEKDIEVNQADQEAAWGNSTSSWGTKDNDVEETNTW